MKQRDWDLLKMLPPSANHDSFHDYVTIDGRLTDKGYALQNFASEMRKTVAERAPKKPEPSPELKALQKEIRAAVSDIGETLMALADWHQTIDVSDQNTAAQKAEYQLHLAIKMIEVFRDHRPYVPWSDLKLQVSEEFS